MISPIVGSAEKVLESMVNLLVEQGGTNDVEAMESWWSEIKVWQDRDPQLLWGELRKHTVIMTMID